MGALPTLWVGLWAGLLGGTLLWLLTLQKGPSGAWRPWSLWSSISPAVPAHSPLGSLRQSVGCGGRGGAGPGAAPAASSPRPRVPAWLVPPPSLPQRESPPSCGRVKGRVSPSDPSCCSTGPADPGPSWPCPSPTLLPAPRTGWHLGHPRPAPWHVPYRRHLKHHTRAPRHETDTDSRAQRTDVCLPRGRGWRRDGLGSGA